MKKIVMINGSPRNNGATAKILKEMKSNLYELGQYDISYMDISKLAIQPCTGCCYCYRKGSCCIEDDGEELSKKIEEANAVIIGTPTYASNMSGQLKTFIDRGHFVVEQLLVNKYVVSVVTGENYGKNDVKKILNKLFLYSGGINVGSIAVNIPFNTNPIKNPKIIKKISTLSQKLDRKLSSNNRLYWQYIQHKLIYYIGIYPFVIKKGTKYQGVLDRWANHNISR